MKEEVLYIQETQQLTNKIKKINPHWSFGQDIGLWIVSFNSETYKVR